MLVHIKRNVITTYVNSADFHLLDKLKLFAVDNRHHIIFEDQQELDTWLSSDLSNGHKYKELLLQNSRAASRLPSEQKKVVVTTGDNCTWGATVAELTLKEAISVLETPLYVLLENSNNDWHFLLKTLDQSSRNRLISHQDKRWIIPVHGGGSQITARIEEFSAKESDKFRTFCIYDSDRRHPDELDPNWSPANTQGCQGYVTQLSASTHISDSHHMLTRRFIESYIPQRELSNYIPHSQLVTLEKIQAYFRLSDNGRWFFNMKKGFHGDNTVENIARAKNMYENISPEDYDVLSNGFGNSIADIYANQDGDFDWDADARLEFSQITPRIMNYL